MTEDRQHSPRAEPWRDLEASKWDDWRWQLKSRVRTLAALEPWMTLTDEERDSNKLMTICCSRSKTARLVLDL